MTITMIVMMMGKILPDSKYDDNDFDNDVDLKCDIKQQYG